MESTDNIYARKKEFVAKMSEALAMIQEIESVEYFNVSDKYSEFIRFTYDGGYSRIFDVTADNLRAIAHEIGRILLNRKPMAEITNEAHKMIVEEWFDEKE